MTCCGSPTGTGSTPTEKPRLEADGRPATALGRSHDRMADLAGIAAADLNVGENSRVPETKCPLSDFGS